MTDETLGKFDPDDLSGGMPSTVPIDENDFIDHRQKEHKTYRIHKNILFYGVGTISILMYALSMYLVICTKPKTSPEIILVSLFLIAPTVLILALSRFTFNNKFAVKDKLTDDVPSLSLNFFKELFEIVKDTFQK